MIALMACKNSSVPMAGIKVFNRKTAGIPPGSGEDSIMDQLSET
jgi:hypothetical protein